MIQNPQQMTVTSLAFLDGGMIPRKHTCDGVNVSPEIRWQGVPDGTRCFVLIMTALPGGLCSRV
jgi:phosphatidylethanolamine-binding protein (PEBP) family uncharacterized protein